MNTPLRTTIRTRQTLSRRAISVMLAAAIAGGAYAYGRTHSPDAHAASLPSPVTASSPASPAMVQGLPVHMVRLDGVRLAQGKLPGIQATSSTAIHPMALEASKAGAPNHAVREAVRLLRHTAEAG